MSACRVIAFFLDEVGAALGCFIDEESHFRVRRLEIGRNSMFAQFLRSHRAYRPHGNPREGVPDVILPIHFGSDFQQVDHLYRSSE